MSDVELLSAHRSRRSESLAPEIAAALEYLGGAAHRDQIVHAFLAKRREAGTAGRVIPSDIEQALRDHDVDNGERRAKAFFVRPFGPTSLRWALYKPAGSEHPEPLRQAADDR
jgi:hypothetical protein